MILPLSEQLSIYFTRLLATTYGCERLLRLLVSIFSGFKVIIIIPNPEEC
jgi:hypothetical protein